MGQHALLLGTIVPNWNCHWPTAHTATMCLLYNVSRRIVRIALLFSTAPTPSWRSPLELDNLRLAGAQEYRMPVLGRESVVRRAGVVGRLGAQE